HLHVPPAGGTSRDAMLPLFLNVKVAELPMIGRLTERAAEPWVFPVGRTKAAAKKTGLLQPAKFTQKRPTAADRTVAVFPAPPRTKGAPGPRPLGQPGKKGQPKPRRRHPSPQPGLVAPPMDRLRPTCQRVLY